MPKQRASIPAARFPLLEVVGIVVVLIVAGILVAAIQAQSLATPARPPAMETTLTRALATLRAHASKGAFPVPPADIAILKDAGVTAVSGTSATPRDIAASENAAWTQVVLVGEQGTVCYGATETVGTAGSHLVTGTRAGRWYARWHASKGVCTGPPYPSGARSPGWSAAWSSTVLGTSLPAVKTSALATP